MSLTKTAKAEPQTPLAPRTEGIAQFRQDINRAIDRAWRAIEQDPWSALSEITPWPAIDVEETENALNLRVDVPGLDPRDIDVQVSDNQLTVSGSRKEEKTEKNGFYRHERYEGSFSRTVTLPPYVNSDKVEAHYDKGVLTLSIPRIPGKGPKRVNIKTT